MQLAPPLNPGDTIAVVAPGSATQKPERLARGLAALKAAGFKVDWHPDSLTRRGYLAGNNSERANQFNRAITRQAVKAIMCVRGGYGAMRILDRIDYGAARKHPKLLIGFSDATALHLALYRHAGWRGLSGPLVVSYAESSPGIQARFWALAKGEIPQLAGGLAAVRTGTAQGVLLGGNLSMIARLVGTPYLPSLEGSILFLEEVNEAPYRIDALLAQLHLAGHLKTLGGLVLGRFTGWEPRHEHPVLTPGQIFTDYFSMAPYPVARGLPYGHFPDRETIPFGVRAKLAVTKDSGSLAVLEPVCG